MRKTKQHKDLFVFDGERFLVRRDASGIAMLIAMCDGMRIVGFKGKKQVYLSLDDVIAWHEKELKQSHGLSGDKVLMEKLKQCRMVLVAKNPC